jgi:hypothetical protein
LLLSFASPTKSQRIFLLGGLGPKDRFQLVPYIILAKSISENKTINPSQRKKLCAEADLMIAALDRWAQNIEIEKEPRELGPSLSRKRGRLNSVIYPMLLPEIVKQSAKFCDFEYCSKIRITKRSNLPFDG